ncbi:MAG: bifunctional [glutamine synthetase] adenylyltransferase/[glutamine synthetase]-adenylyl-L-tyrosine phosphorylase, partial [Pseudonocardiales bacterium]|nr:bifunctional [glutamine synthetase] adenylyltransferase/[glutamine synthetase]-adenylyl-L-tyrosine phosphorylase [Pseudonocardiales bacterium]
MTEGGRTGLSLARLGLTDDGAGTTLTKLGWWGNGQVRQDAEDALWALSRAPDPNLALRALGRLASAAGPDWAQLDAALRQEPGVRGHLFGLLGSSTALGDHLVAHPSTWHGVTSSGALQPGWADCAAQRLLAAVGGDAPGPAPAAGATAVTAATLTGVPAQRALRDAHRDLIAELAAADLAAVVEPDLPVVPFERVADALADLATGVLRAALAVAITEVTSGAPLPRLAVIAMGKCGGAELNYVSDVDVIFVADGEDELAVATKLASATMRVASACFEVDAALRPEGKAGALVRTLDGHLSYYRRWANTWEFQALLKARPVAGDAELGGRYLEAVAPMVWTAADRENFVPEVQAMRRRVAEHVPAELVDRELKVGHGGLRDVEFAVQLLQLVHGRTDESLRVRSTVEALTALAAGGYVGRDDAANLAASYRFLRLLEHRLQLQRLRRTHLLPPDSDTAAWRWLARAAGMRPDGRHDALGVLRIEYTRQSHRARRLHQKLFYRPLLEAVAKVPTEVYRLSESSAKARLAALGYASPQGALAHLRALTGGVSRRAAIQSTLLPVLLEFLADTPDPDRGLAAYRRVSEALDDTPWYLRFLRDEGAVAQRLMALLGTSGMVVDLLVRAPEALQLLADPAEMANRDPAEVATSLRATAGRHHDLGAAVTAARALRRHELFRIACADLLGVLDLDAVCAALSSVWTAVLTSALEVALRAEVERRQAQPARIAVIGMGRLGGAELGYGSDADVLFVCEPSRSSADAETEAVRFAASVAESVRNLLGSPSQDPPLVVDTGLRPEGRMGPLVRTSSSYRAYYTQWAQTWEAQALLRAVPLAGDRDLGERFVAMIDPVRYPAGGLTA